MAPRRIATPVLARVGLHGNHDWSLRTMAASVVRLFSDRVAAARLVERFSRIGAISLLRVAVQDLFPGRIALVSSFRLGGVAPHGLADRSERPP